MALLAVAGGAGAQQVENLGAHRFGSMEEFQRIIDTKCIICHSSERVDIAIRKRQALEKFQQHLRESVPDLTERDKKVLGTFWGRPGKDADTQQ